MTIYSENSASSVRTIRQDEEAWSMQLGGRPLVIWVGRLPFGARRRLKFKVNDEEWEA
jgi:hypothetical protein